MKLKGSIIFVLFVFCVQVAHAQKVSNQMQELSNQVVRKIYGQILDEKNYHFELQDFDQGALTEGRDGRLIIEYEQDVYTATSINAPIAFGLTIIGINQTSGFENMKGEFNYALPLLDLKISGHEIQNFKKKRFDLQKIIQRHGEILLELQQKYMPYRLKMMAIKEKFEVGDDIVFDVFLKNMTNTNIMVKPLSSSTLYFLYGDTQWGVMEEQTGERKPEQQIVLKPGQQIKERFVGTGFDSPSQFDIYCSYSKEHKGVRSFANLSIAVE